MEESSKQHHFKKTKLKKKPEDTDQFYIHQ